MCLPCENHRKIGTFYKEWYLFTLTVVLHGEIVLSEFTSLERAEEYTVEYVSKNLGLTIFKEVIGNESSDYIKAYDTSYNMKQWVFLKRIR